MRQTSLSLTKLQDQPKSNLENIFKTNENLLFSYRIKNIDSGIEILDQIDFSDSAKNSQQINADEFKANFLKIKNNNSKFFSDHVEYLEFNRKKIFYVANNIPDNANELVVTFFSGDIIFELLSNDKIFTNSFFILNDNKIQQLIGNKDLFKLSEKLKSQVSQKGAVEHEVSNDKYLLAYVKYPQDNFIIISSMPSAKAFEVTKSLILKTVFFAFSLLGFAVALGIFFSVSITKPIQILTDASKKISVGDFNIVTKIRSNDELKILSNSFDFMAKEIQNLLGLKEAMIYQLNVANLKLEDYSKNLEVMVADRTAELKNANDFMGAMVNSLDQGLVVFDENLKCNDIFTNASVELFGKNPKDLTYQELLVNSQDGLDTSLADWAKITFSGMLDFQSAIGLAPKVKKWGHSFKDSDFKQIEIKYFPMRDGEVLKNVVAVATEKTKEIQSIELFREKEQYVAMILKVLANKSQFASFVKEVNSIFEQIFEVISENKLQNDTEKYLEFCMMQFHTLNGGFGLFYILHLQQLARSCEEQISSAVKSSKEIEQFRVELESLANQLKNEFVQFLIELDQTLGVSFSKGSRSIEIPKESILKIKVLVDNLGVPDLTKYFYEDFVREPVFNYFSMYDDLVQKTSDVLGKKINSIIFENEFTKVEADKYSEFFNSLIHLFRNCVDHGIESPEQRLSLGKSDFGSIKVSFSKEDYQFKLSIKDDGGGINPEVIRNRLLTIDSTKDYSGFSDEDIILEIFSPFFSTKDVVSSISGRGVGMSVIKEIVDRMNGKIMIKTKVGEGTQFSFEFPEVS